MRNSFKLSGLLLLLVAALTLYGMLEARRDPVLHRATVALPDWPAGTRPVRVLLMSDLHIGSLAMDAARLQRIVRQANALKPDIVMIAGDFIAGHDAATARKTAPDLAAALSGLVARLGVVAVLGNHDHATDPAIVTRALRAANIRVLANQAVQLGPLAIGGIDDKATGHDDAAATFAAMRRLRGARILVSHGPDTVYSIRAVPALRGDTTLLLAGHTHCGQIELPGLGPVKSLFDPRIPDFCGDIVLERHRVIVTGGLGTSILPLRIGAPPDLWLLTMGPAGTPTGQARR